MASAAARTRKCGSYAFVDTTNPEARSRREGRQLSTIYRGVCVITRERLEGRACDARELRVSETGLPTAFSTHTTYPPSTGLRRRTNYAHMRT